MTLAAPLYCEGVAEGNPAGNVPLADVWIETEADGRGLVDRVTLVTDGTGATGVTDTGVTDTGTGVTDTGVTDTGTGVTDTGVTETGVTDTGVTDGTGVDSWIGDV